MYLIPKPQKMSYGEGRFDLSYDSTILIEDGCPEAYSSCALSLQSKILDETGFSLTVTKGSSRRAAIVLRTDSSLAAQGYEIEVNQNGVFLSAAEKAGMFYAVQTLVQILQQTGAGIPCLKIQDYPEMPVRGLCYDVSRSRIPTMDYLKKLIDLLAHYKINQFQLYIEHTYLFEGLSEVWRDDTPLSAQDILELDLFCRERNIELVPCMATFGHMYKILRTKEYADLGEFPEQRDDAFGFMARMEHHTIDASRPESLDFVKGLIREYMSLFSSDKFNICGDETFDLGKGRSRKTAEQIGEQQLYVRYIKELCEFVVEQGKTPMFWGDIICKSPELVKELPADTICLSWGYSETQDDDAIRALDAAGARQYCCPGVHGWKHLVNDTFKSYENIRLMCGYARKYHAAGVLNTVWGDFGHVNHPDFDTAGIIYGAAFSWNSEIPSFEEINRQISRLEFGDRSEQFVSLTAEISKNEIFGWQDAVFYKEQRRPAFTEEQLAGSGEAQSALKEIKDRLIGLMPELGIEGRAMIPVYLVAVDGIILLQRLGRALSEIDKKTAVTGSVDYRALARDLENWFFNYKIEWRKVSRESELYQIQDVIFYFADLLRDKA